MFYVKKKTIKHLFSNNTKAAIGDAVLDESASSVSRRVTSANDHIPTENRLIKKSDN